MILGGPARTVLRLPAQAITEGGPPVPLERLRGALALHVEGVLPRSACAAYARAVYAGRSSWIPNFDGVQYTLGRAYYVHLETGREDDYFGEVAASDAAVERFVPGLAAHLLALLRRCVGADVARRPGYCGPGVHVFPAGAHVSHHGGDIHWDLEGVGDAEIAARADAVTAVLMLQPAAQGGGLRIWDKRHEDDDTEEAPGSAPSEVVTYGAGDLVVLDSYRLHQICPSSGPLDRISATAHAVRTPQGWQAWF